MIDKIQFSNFRRYASHIILPSAFALLPSLSQAISFDIVPLLGLNPGVNLSYQTTEGSQTYTEISEIGPATNFGGYQALQRKWTLAGASKPYKTEYLNYDEDQFCIYGDEGNSVIRTFNPPVCIPRLISIGQKISAITKINGMPVNVTYELEIQGWEPISALGQELDTLRLLTRVAAGSTSQDNTSWFSSGVGLVKRRLGTTTSILTSFSGPSLVSSVLPYARAVGVGKSATAFANIINIGTLPGKDCKLALPAEIPAEFNYQTTNVATNQIIGTPNTPIDIPAGGTQGFVFAIKPTQSFPAEEIALDYICANGPPAPIYDGVNTFILSAAVSPPPDMLAVGGTLSGDGVVRLGNKNGVSAFAASALNIGSSGVISVSVDDGGLDLPLKLAVCETNASGQFIQCSTDQVSRSVNANGVVFHTVTVQAQGVDVPFLPQENRLFLRYRYNGTTVGATTVAVTTTP